MPSDVNFPCIYFYTLARHRYVVFSQRKRAYEPSDVLNHLNIYIHTYKIRLNLYATKLLQNLIVLVEIPQSLLPEDNLIVNVIERMLYCGKGIICFSCLFSRLLEVDWL